MGYKSPSIKVTMQDTMPSRGAFDAPQLNQGLVSAASALTGCKYQTIIQPKDGLSLHSLLASLIHLFNEGITRAGACKSSV